MRLFIKLQPYLLFFFFSILYLHNLSPSVYGGDVGDFVTAAAIGGVAHAPGYPLFILLGFLLIHIFPFFTSAFAMGCISALSGSAGVMVCFLLVRRLTKSNSVALVTSITLGFSYLFWFYSEIAEVFALHSFFILLLFFFAVVFDQTRKPKYLFFFSFVFGLAALTHQTIILFFPSFLLMLAPGILKTKKILIKCLGFLLAPGLLYVYVFIASAHHPVINWDDVHDLSSFLQLILRRDYGTFHAGLFAQPVFAQRVIILRTYLFSLLTQITIPVVAVSIFGFFVLFMKSKRYAISLLLAFFLTGPLFVGYAGFPLEASFFFGVYERFFIMSTIPIFILFGYGLYILAKIFAKTFKRPIYFLLLNAVFLLIPLQLFFYNIQKTDLSHVWVGDMLGSDFLVPLPKNSVLLLGGDTALFNTWYMHYARHVRPDVKMINLSLAYLDPFIQKEEHIVTSRLHHSPKGNELIALTFEEIGKKLPVFSYDQLQAPGKTNLQWIPNGLLYRLAPANNSLTEEEFLTINEMTLHQIHMPLANTKNYKNLTIAEIPQIYAKPIWAIGNYLLQTYKDPDKALFYYKKSLSIDPTFENAYITLGLIYLTTKNNCPLAENAFHKALDYKPYDEFPYFLLYTTYEECYHNTTEANTVIKLFTKQFHKKFFDELAYALKAYKK